MTPTTESIIDFNERAEWLPHFTPYSFYNHETGGTAGTMLHCEAENVHAPMFVPGKYSITFMKSFFEVELLSNVPSSFLFFLNNRRQHVQDGDTYKTIIDQKDIDILSSLIKGRTASRPVVVPLSREAEAFCSHQDILKYVNVASDLINQCFSNVRGVDSEILQDPDTEDQMLVIHVEVKGEIDAVLDMYDKYTAEWVLRVPWPERAKISFSYITI